MLEDQGDYKPTYNTADAPPNSNNSQANTDIISISDATDSYDVTSFLESAFNLMGDHPEAKDTVAADLMALNQAWK